MAVLRPELLHQVRADAVPDQAVEEEAPLARCRSETKIDEIIFYIEILFDA
jgi:hypothetical protein